jgi:hypothetical protein
MNVVFFLFCDYPTSEFYMPTFWNTLFHIHRRCPNNPTPVILPVYTVYEDGTECSETSGYKIQTLRDHPKEGIENGNYFTTILQHFNLFNAANVFIILGKAVSKPTHFFVTKVYRGLPWFTVVYFSYSKRRAVPPISLCFFPYAYP